MNRSRLLTALTCIFLSATPLAAAVTARTDSAPFHRLVAQAVLLPAFFAGEETF